MLVGLPGIPLLPVLLIDLERGVHLGGLLIRSQLLFVFAVGILANSAAENHAAYENHEHNEGGYWIAAASTAAPIGAEATVASAAGRAATTRATTPA